MNEPSPNNGLISLVKRYKGKIGIGFLVLYVFVSFLEKRSKQRGRCKILRFLAIVTDHGGNDLCYTEKFTEFFDICEKIFGGPYVDESHF